MSSSWRDGLRWLILGGFAAVGHATVDGGGGNFTAVETLVLTRADRDLTGFVEGFSDATFGYLVPYRHRKKMVGNLVGFDQYHGKVARFDLATFSDVAVLDLTGTRRELKGFMGGFRDATHGYVVPFYDGEQYHGRVARFELATFGGVAVLDLGAADASLRGFHGGFCDSVYGYAVPNRNAQGIHGSLVRFGLATFSGVEVLDLAAADGDLRGLFGGFRHAAHGYLVTHQSEGHYSGKVARFDLATFGGVVVLDAAAVDAGLVGFHGGFDDAAYGYLVPYYNGTANSGKVGRFELATFGAVAVLDLASADPELTGFLGGFADAVYGYLVPYHNGHYSGKVARFDLATFSDVAVLDLAATSADLRGFYGGFAAGGYGYVVPCRQGNSYKGTVARFGAQARAPPTSTTATETSTRTSPPGAAGQRLAVGEADSVETSDTAAAGGEPEQDAGSMMESVMFFLALVFVALAMWVCVFFATRNEWVSTTGTELHRTLSSRWSSDCATSASGGPARVIEMQA